MKSSFAYVLAPVLGYFVAQITKDVLGRRDITSWKEWFRSGSMPSSHTAIVIALLAVIFFNEGVTPLFAVTGTFAALIIHDALVVRRSVGEQGIALKQLLRKLKRDDIATPHVAMGHKPLEVIVGGSIGLVIGYAVALFITI